jgi:hypothetical protein
LKHASSIRFRPHPAIAAVLLGTAFAAFAAAVAAEPERAARVDAQCPWGRLGDGHGRFVRCLTEDDVAHLRDVAATPPRPPEAPKAATPAPEAAKPPALSTTAPAEPVKGAETLGNAVWPLPAPKAPAEAPAPAPPVPAPPPEPSLSAELGPVVADSGTLSDSKRSLRKAVDKIAECAEKNGGLTADRGEVELRFLVQERGRAEGVSLKKRRGLGEAAAKCIADVVDRRFVGFPEEPAVGATLVVTIAKKKK